MNPTDLVAYVDVDDTLVRSIGGARIPIPDAIRHVRDLHTAGATLFCWSAGGADYARASAKELGIEALFTSFLPKPHVMIDDHPPGEWPHLIVATPRELAGRTAEDHIEALARRRRER